MAISDLANTGEYLIEAYRQAESALADYGRTQNQAALAAAASYLCTGLERLRVDPVFWAALVDLNDEYEAHKGEADSVIDDLDGAFEMESDVLTARLGDPALATRLLGDVSLALDNIHDQLRSQGHLSGAAIGLLQSQCEQLRAAVCVAGPLVGSAPEGPSEKRRLMRAFRVTLRAFRFVSGAACVVINGSAAAANPAVLPASIVSVLAGLDAMANGRSGD